MSVYDANNVPVVYLGPDRKIGLSDEAHGSLRKATATARKAADVSKHLLLGHSVVIHNKAPVGSDQEAQSAFSIGASTLDEALKEVIGAFDLSHVGDRDVSSDDEYPPDWVASSHKELGRLLADYYSCEQRDIAAGS